MSGKLILRMDFLFFGIGVAISRFAGILLRFHTSYEETAVLERMIRVEHSQKFIAAFRLAGFSDGVGALRQAVNSA